MTFQTNAHVPGSGYSPITVCCQNFAAAMQPCTDNEGYGTLIYIVGPELQWTLGSGPLAMPFHCPWCGALAKIEKL